MDRYTIDKNTWIKNTRTKQKKKLRKHIADIARAISKTQDGSFELNRTYVIKAYNAGGLEGVRLWYAKAIEEYKEIGQQPTKED